MGRFARATLSVKAAVALTIFATLGSITATHASATTDSAASPGVISYSDWSWSVSGSLYDQMRGTKLHREDGTGSWYGISAQVKGSAEYGALLQRNLSWVDDGYVSIAESQNDRWVRDNKRYQMSCGDYIQYRVINFSDYPEEIYWAYSSRIYAC